MTGERLTTIKDSLIKSSFIFRGWKYYDCITGKYKSHANDNFWKRISEGEYKVKKDDFDYIAPDFVQLSLF